jgi:broad specificity phosphatase PhoE
MIYFVPRFQLFVRHAHRDKVAHRIDDGLSDKGHRQGRKLLEYLEAHFAKERAALKHIYSSPKPRCLETAHYVSRWQHLEIEMLPSIDEQGIDESNKVFEARMDKLFERIQKSQDSCAYVSHGDVLPALLLRYGVRDFDGVKKGNLFVVRAGRVEHLNRVK